MGDLKREGLNNFFLRKGGLLESVAYLKEEGARLIEDLQYLIYIFF